MATAYQILDKRDRDYLENSITELDNKTYENKKTLQANIDDLNSRHEALKSYSENNKALIDNLTTDKISHSEVIDTINSELALEGNYEKYHNVPLSARQGGIIFNRDQQLQKQINANEEAINTEKTRATGIETGLDNRLKTVEGDVNTFLANADLTENAIDTLKEIQTYIDSDKTAASQMTANIASNKKAIDAEVTRATGVEASLESAVEARIPKAAIVDNLTTADVNKVLSANQGVKIKETCDSLSSAIQERVHKNLIVDNLTTAEATKVLSANQGVVIKGMCDDITQKVTENKNEITSLNQALQERVLKASIADNLTTNESVKVLSAKQGVVLKGLFDSIPSWSMADTKPTYTYSEVGADKSGTAASAVSTHNTSADCHSDIRESITNVTSALTERVPKAAIIDNLTTADANKVLSANQGVELKNLYDGINSDVTTAKENITALTTAVQERVLKSSIVDSVEDNLGEGGKLKVLSANQGVELNKLITTLTNTVAQLTERVVALEGGSNSANDSKEQGATE